MKIIKANQWFSGFLSSFKEGENRISEKQFDVFERYLSTEYVNGYINGYQDYVKDGEITYKVKVIRWDCITGARYYLEKYVV